MCQEWILTSKLIISGELVQVELTTPQKYSILKSFYASPYFTSDEKKALKLVALKDDNSDEATLVS